MKHHVVDLTEPSDKGETVEIKTPAGTVRITAGLVEPLSYREVVLVEVHQRLDWEMETKPSPSGRTDLRFAKLEE